MVSLNDVLLAMSNIPVSDPIAEIWGRGLQGGYEIIEYTGTLPITINADGNALLDYRIYGNIEQTGTPTPENPIVPEGCGERVDITGLSDPLCGINTYTDSLDLSTGILTRRIKKLVLTGGEGWTITSNSILRIGIVGQLRPSTPLCTHYLGSDSTEWSNVPDKSVTVSIRGYLAILDTTYTTPANFKSYLAAQYAAGTPVTIWYVLAEPEVSTIPTPSGLTGAIEGYLIQDGTPTPEAPIYPTANGVKQADDTYSIEYGYKLPILSNSTVTNIYLGEVETTRRIKKLVLTGEENWTITMAGNMPCARIGVPETASTEGNINRTPVCTHYIGTYSDANGKCRLINSITLQIADSVHAVDLPTWTAFLAAQYAAGTPVTVWYVLAEPETSIVNEPLMKISDYADTLSMEQADVSIPTFTGTTVIDCDGELKPSQMYIKYRR